MPGSKVEKILRAKSQFAAAGETVFMVGILKRYPRGKGGGRQKYRGQLGASKCGKAGWGEARPCDPYPEELSEITQSV